MSQLKIYDGNTWVGIPAGGVGVPSGGTAGQYLKKSSSTDYATEWSSFGYETESIQSGTNYMVLYHNADTGILVCRNAYPSTAIPNTGVTLPITPKAGAIAPCMYYNGSSNVFGFMYIDTDLKFYLLDNTLSPKSATYVSGQLVFPIA